VEDKKGIKNNGKAIIIMKYINSENIQLRKAAEVKQAPIIHTNETKVCARHHF
jgi:hypothetical protein